MVERKEKLSAALFPHSHASDKEIRRVLSFFDMLTIFQPWHMEDKFSTPRERGLKVIHPPDHLRPIEGFPSLLSEYKTWIRQHPDKGYASALSAVRKYWKDEEALWDIRRSIRHPEQGEHHRHSAATRWHLLLHLARESEESLRWAGEVLRVLRERGSPLRDAVTEEEEPASLLDDLSDFDQDLETDGEFLRMIFDAWQGLFGALLERDDVVVTLSQPIFENVSALWSEHLSEEEADGVCRFCWPDLACDKSEGIHLQRNDEPLREIRDAVIRRMRNPAGEMETLSSLARDLESNPKWVGKEKLHFRMRPFAPNTGIGARGKSMSGLSGRVIFLLEESCHG
jgi:hypothetical protein